MSLHKVRVRLSKTKIESQAQPDHNRCYHNTSRKASEFEFSQLGVQSQIWLLRTGGAHVGGASIPLSVMKTPFSMRVLLHLNLSLRGALAIVFWARERLQQYLLHELCNAVSQLLDSFCQLL